jgi:hypothetical protein
LEQITLEVLDPDTNAAVYFESRDRVDLDNDVKRLFAHFFTAVDDTRASAEAALLGLYGSIGGASVMFSFTKTPP